MQMRKDFGPKQNRELPEPHKMGLAGRRHSGRPHGGKPGPCQGSSSSSLGLCRSSQRRRRQLGGQHSCFDGPLSPYQEFTKHTSPLPSENQSTALFDPRWSEVFLGTLRERESYNEAKKKLQGNKQGNNKNDDPPGNPPGGRKGKGKGDGGSGDKPDK